MEGILLINTREPHKVVNNLLDFPEIISAYSVYGQFNVVAMAQAEDLRSLIKLLKKKISEIESITMLIPDKKDLTLQQSYGGLV